MASTSAGDDDGIKEESRPLLQPSTSQTSAETKPPVTKKTSTVFRQFLILQVFLGIIIALPSVPCGMSLGFSAVTFEQLNLNVDEASWYASVTIMAFPIGSILVGPLMDKYGRRPALMLINVISLLGWLLLAVPATPPSVAKLISGRIITGIAGGVASVPAAVYAGECLCAQNLEIRTALVSWSTVALSAGICLVFTAGAALDYYAVASIATLISITSLILVAIFIPESPAWLILKGRHGDAEWSQREINIVPLPGPLDQPSEVEDLGQTAPPPPPPAPEPQTIKELLKPEAYKPLLIMIGFLFFQQFSGVFVIIAYMVDIVISSGVMIFNPYTVTVVAGWIILLVSVLASIIYPKTGVRAIAALSGIGITASMLFIGSYLSLRHYWLLRPGWSFLEWAPVIAILANIAVSTIGFLILPWSMLGEVFPLTVKGLAAGIATCLGFLFGFIALKIYPYIQLGVGSSGVFFFFGSMALIGTIFVVLFLPETRGKSLQEILDGFSKKKKKDTNK
ncbi:hypothetical protein O3M35_008291 [Rhynocoris fuscipes]|uniref:Major facilitator superfamily (MFS) profile domain-containing protein n=1 Tax=Rhynocoris fuscipes TaxID=488301 RepID=A0AAW1D9A3_9HEMI